MATWTNDELSTIAAAEELELASVRHDGTLGNAVTIWIVRVDDDVYVRSWKGHNGAWFRATQRATRVTSTRAASARTSRSCPKRTRRSMTGSTPSTAGSIVVMADATSIPWWQRRRERQRPSWSRAQQLRSSSGRHEARFMDRRPRNRSGLLPPGGGAPSRVDANAQACAARL